MHRKTTLNMREWQYVQPGISPCAVGRVGKPPSHGVVDRKREPKTTDVACGSLFLSTTEWRLIHAVHSIYHKRMVKKTV